MILSRLGIPIVCRAWLAYRVDVRGDWSGSKTPALSGEQLITDGGHTLGFLFRVMPRGFILVPARKELCPVWFFSETGSLDFTEDGPAVQALRGRLALVTGFAAADAELPDPIQRELRASASDRNRSLWAAMTERPGDWARHLWPQAASVGPLLSTTWTQGPPFDLLCPAGLDSARCVVGCTPLAAAQIARYHASPRHGGNGEEYYDWVGDRCAHPHVGGRTLYADFRDDYDWEQMPDACWYSCGGEADSAVAELCYELGVGGHVSYGTNCGTSANLEQLVQALQEHLGYDNSTRPAFRSESANPHDWFAQLRAEINELQPVLYSFCTTQGDGHSLVCDGWGVFAGVEYVALNLGSGGVTGWYAADDNGMSDPASDHAILGLTPSERIVTIDPGGTGDHPDIQAAIDAAPDKSVIRLRGGVYRGPGNRDLDCRGKRLTICSQSNDPSLCVIDCEGTPEEPHRAFIFQNNETYTTMIRGLTVRNGWARRGTDGRPALGGAVLCESNASPFISNCVFVQNRSGLGGAIGCADLAAPWIDGCVFWDNAPDSTWAPPCMDGQQEANILLDPQFCDLQAGSFGLQPTSPCAPRQPGNQGCGPVGASRAGCEHGVASVLDAAAASTLVIRRCAPNPFSGEIQIDYTIGAAAVTRTLDLSIFDVAGRLVRTLSGRASEPGDHTVVWDARDDRGRRVGSGAYFCRLRSGTENATQRLILLR